MESRNSIKEIQSDIRINVINILRCKLVLVEFIIVLIFR